MKEITAVVFDIQRFSIHDGPGIRTAVFLKGCPLTCAWCHNPESWDPEPVIAYDPGRCLGCGACVTACPNSAHTVDAGGHAFDRDRCTACGRCTRACPAAALERAGSAMTVSEVMTAVMRDLPFYRDSGGGLTVTGGEPLARPEFTAALCEAAHENGIHTAIETSGWAASAAVERVLRHCDLVLLDLKAAPADHERLTGVPFDPVEAALACFTAAGIPVHLRLPLVPEVNDTDDHFANIGRLVRVFNVEQVAVLPYHRLGTGKRERFGLPPAVIDPEMPDEALIAKWHDKLDKVGVAVVSSAGN